MLLTLSFCLRHQSSGILSGSQLSTLPGINTYIVWIEMRGREASMGMSIYDYMSIALKWLLKHRQDVTLFREDKYSREDSVVSLFWRRVSAQLLGQEHSRAEQCTVCIVSNNPVLGVTVNIVLQIKLFREKYSTECFIVLVWGLEVKWEFIVHILSVLTRPGLPWSHPVRERVL